MAETKRIETPEQAEFREYCRTWLKDNHPGTPPVPIPQSALELKEPEAMAWLQEWQKSAWEAGLVGTDYSTEYGGRGKDGLQLIANQEMQRAKRFLQTVRPLRRQKIRLLLSPRR